MVAKGKDGQEGKEERKEERMDCLKASGEPCDHRCSASHLYQH